MYGQLVPSEGGDPIPLSKAILRIGRRSSSDIILYSAEVSSLHAELRIIDGFWWIFDKRSKNGVWVNGVCVPKKRLEPGDTVAFGDQEYTIEYPEEDEAADGELSSRLTGFLEIIEAGQQKGGKQGRTEAGRSPAVANGSGEVAARLHAHHERQEHTLVVVAIVGVVALILLALGIWFFRSGGGSDGNGPDIAELPEGNQQGQPSLPAENGTPNAAADPETDTPDKPETTQDPDGGQNVSEGETPDEQAVAGQATKPDKTNTTPAAEVKAPPVEPSTPKPETVPKPETTPAPEMPPGPKRLPIPSREAQKEMMGQFDEVYKFSEQKTAAQKIELSKRLFDSGGKSQGGPTEKFIFFRSAIEFAQNGGNADLMLQIMDTFGEEFDVDVLELKQKLLAGFIAGNPGEERIEPFFGHTELLIDQALAQDRYEMAESLADTAYKLAQRPVGILFREQASRRRSEVQKLAVAWGELQQVRAKLAANPDDPQANLALGRWLCLKQGRWEQGLPHLAKCNTPSLQSLASQELTSPPTESNAQIKLADAWWALAKEATGTEKNALMRHAGEWYEKAQPTLPEGFGKDKVENRLAEIAKLGHSATTEPPAAVVPAKETPVTRLPGSRKLRKELTLNLGDGVEMEFILIPAGAFEMGDADGKDHEKPVHKVTITRPFYMGKYEVTQQQWQALMGDNPSKFKEPKNPVEYVSWEACQEFLTKLNEKSGKSGLKFGLPTEAQWEYSCRAESKTRWSFGDEAEAIEDYAWFNDNSAGKSHLVGQKKPNAWGLYDMHGNVVEWCADRYGKDYYKESPPADPSGKASSYLHVVRGGSFNFSANGQRSACRATGWPTDCFNDYGFRVTGVPADVAKDKP